MSTFGKLILAGTDIGNSEDRPLRSLAALKTADLLVFEEDRPARSFLKHAGIFREYLKLTEHCEKDTLAEVTEVLQKGGTVLYMSDQGMPNLADPGRLLTEIAFAYDAKIEVIPGPSSLTAAISACPFVDGRFLFYGFLSREERLRRGELKTLSQYRWPTVVLDTPYRLIALLRDCESVFAEAQLFLALDISGVDEAYYFHSAAILLKKLNSNEKNKKNFVLILPAT